MSTASQSSNFARFTGRDALSAALVAAIGALALWPLLFTRQALYWGDIELYFAPMQSFLNQSLALGRIPLWNHFILCGEPFVGNPQTWPLYPSTLLAAGADSWRFLTLSCAIHLILGGMLFYGFLRGEGICRRAGSVLGAVCFMLGGYFVTKIQFPNMAQAIAWTPAILWAAGRLARAPGFRTALMLGVALGLQLLAAHAQITLLTGYLALAYALFTAWPRLRDEGGGWRGFAGLAGWGLFALAAACCLDGGELLPTLEVWRHSDRQILTLGTANRFVLSAGRMVGLIAPDAFGSPFDGDFHGSGNYWETACYLGIAPCLLAAIEIAAGWARRTRETLFWTGVMLASLWLATGRSGGLYTLAFHLMPGVKAFHDPARFLICAAVAGATLAGRGLERLLGSRQMQTCAPAVRLGVSLGLIALAGVDLAHFDRRAYPLMPVASLDAAVQAARNQDADRPPAHGRVMYPPDNKATWRYFVDYKNYRRGDPAYFSSLLATHTTNTGMLLGIADAGGYEPEPPKGAVRRYIEAYNTHRQGRGDARMDALRVGSVVAFAPGGAPGARGGYFATHRMSVWRNPAAQLISRARLDDGRPVPASDMSPDETMLELPAGASQETVRIADTDAPGWKAYLRPSSGRGAAVEMMRTSDGLRAVRLPGHLSGGERLVMRYEPAAWRVGLFLTLLTLAWVTGCAMYAVLSRRRAGAL